MTMPAEPPPEIVDRVREDVTQLMLASARSIAAGLAETCSRQVWAACLSACMAQQAVDGSGCDKAGLRDGSDATVPMEIDAASNALSEASNASLAGTRLAAKPEIVESMATHCCLRVLSDESNDGAAALLLPSMRFAQSCEDYSVLGLQVAKASPTIMLVPICHISTSDRIVFAAPFGTIPLERVSAAGPIFGIHDVDVSARNTTVMAEAPRHRISVSLLEAHAGILSFTWHVESERPGVCFELEDGTHVMPVASEISAATVGRFFRERPVETKRMSSDSDVSTSYAIAAGIEENTAPTECNDIEGERLALEAQLAELSDQMNSNELQARVAELESRISSVKEDRLILLSQMSKEAQEEQEADARPSDLGNRADHAGPERVEMAARLDQEAVSPFEPDFEGSVSLPAEKHAQTVRPDSGTDARRFRCADKIKVEACSAVPDSGPEAAVVGVESTVGLALDGEDAFAPTFVVPASAPAGVESIAMPCRDLDDAIAPTFQVPSLSLGDSRSAASQATAGAFSAPIVCAERGDVEATDDRIVLTLATSEAMGPGVRESVPATASTADVHAQVHATVEEASAERSFVDASILAARDQSDSEPFDSIEPGGATGRTDDADVRSVDLEFAALRHAVETLVGELGVLRPALQDMDAVNLHAVLAADVFHGGDACRGCAASASVAGELGDELDVEVRTFSVWLDSACACAAELFGRSNEEQVSMTTCQTTREEGGASGNLEQSRSTC